MIEKLLILLDNKLVLNKFTIYKRNNHIIVESLDYNNDIIKVPILSKNNGIDYIPICFPLELIIINENIFNPYLIVSSYNLMIDNDIDFFFQINKAIVTTFNLKMLDFKYFLEDKTESFIKIMNENYSNYFSINNIIKSDCFIKSFWFYIIINKIYVMYVIIKFSNNNIKIKQLKENTIMPTNIPKQIITLSNQLLSYKYCLASNSDETIMSLSEYNMYNMQDNIKLTNIIVNVGYYITTKLKESVSSTSISLSTNTIEKVLKVNIKAINKNVIIIDISKNILFDNYVWYFYNPNIVINKEYIYYQTYINTNFTNEIISKVFTMLSIETFHSRKILDYYNNNQLVCNLVSFRNIITNIFDDMTILKNGSYSDSFFEYITKQYSNDTDIYKILEVLFENYNYPLKPNKQDLDTNFDHIIYFSLYNYKNIFINTKSYNNINELLHPNINSIIPVKFKNLYINLLRALNQMINNVFESITYNQKFYNDYLYRNIIKKFLSDSNKLCIKLFRSLMKPLSLEKFKNIVLTNILLIDITHKLSWKNLSRKLNYLSIFYKNENIIHYMDKINKNIIPDNFDIRLKKIIENPFEMYQYLRKEKDFIRWTKFISNKILLLYLVPISLSSEDFILIGRMIYLLFNIKDQNIKEPTYIEFINFCSNNSKLILDSSRINLKIREYFSSIQANINLGFLAKQLTYNCDIITFNENLDKTNPNDMIINLETKIKMITKKYYKYKVKYLNNKNTDNKYSQKSNVSDTSPFSIK